MKHLNSTMKVMAKEDGGNKEPNDEGKTGDTDADGEGQSDNQQEGTGNDKSKTDTTG